MSEAETELIQNSWRKRYSKALENLDKLERSAYGERRKFIEDADKALVEGYKKGEWEGPLNKIGNKIRDDLKNVHGWTDNQCRHVSDYLPDDHKLDYSNREMDNVHVLENLNPEVLDPFTQQENLAKVDDLDEVYQKIRYAKERIEKYADTHGKALVNHEPNRGKISTEPDKNPGYSQEYHVVDNGIPILEDMTQLVIAVRDKIFKNPAHNANEKQHKEMAEKIGSFFKMCETFNKFLRSCVDEKYSFTLLGHAEMRANIDARSKHGAAVKAVIPVMRNGVITDEVRKMTRERAGDEAEEILQWMKDMTDLMKLSAYWQGFAEWRDVYSTLNNRIAARKVDLSPDLSEKAIG